MVRASAVHMLLLCFAFVFSLMTTLQLQQLQPWPLQCYLGRYRDF